VAVVIAPRPAAAPVPAASAAVAGDAAGEAHASVSAPDFNRVQAIVNQRCVSCHAAQPTQPGFATAPAGIKFDTPELIRQNAAKINQQAVVLKAMPIGNMTNITPEERSELGAWFAAGAN